MKLFQKERKNIYQDCHPRHLTTKTHPKNTKMYFKRRCREIFLKKSSHLLLKKHTNYPYKISKILKFSQSPSLFLRSQKEKTNKTSKFNSIFGKIIKNI